MIRNVEAVPLDFHMISSHQLLTPTGIPTDSQTNGLKQLLALVGSALLFVGVFCPIVSIPIVGQMNYFQNGKGDGTIILVLAAASAFLALTKSFRFLWLTGGGSLGILVFTFVRFQSGISEMKRQLRSDLRDNPFAGLADLAIQSVQLQWGIAILAIGGVLIIAAAALRSDGRRSLQPLGGQQALPPKPQEGVCLEPYSDPFEKWQREQKR